MIDLEIVNIKILLTPLIISEITNYHFGHFSIMDFHH